MLVNLNWLVEYINGEVKVEELSGLLMSLGFEVEETIHLKEKLGDIKVGFIKEKKPHPDAEGWNVCQIDLGELGTKQIICTSEHPVEEKWGVPVALEGTRLPTGLLIKSDKYRGVLSEGMICLDKELGMISRGSGLQVFDESIKPGTPINEAADIPDILAEVAILPNRPDCLALIGLAREVCAALKVPIKFPPANLKELPKVTTEVPVDIENPEDCNRYTCRLIKNVKVAPSPQWLASKLISAGSRPINNVVDITNYVLMEWGHPLHAFDYDKLHEGRIIVRRAKDGERLLLLDDTDLKLTPDYMVIADGDRPVALAGIMGGKETETNFDTTTVLLESAYFNAVLVRQSSRALGVRTDASYHFERGMDPNYTLEMALDRAAALICELAGGEVEPKRFEAYPLPIEPNKLKLTPEKIESYLGQSVEQEKVKDLFERLSMKVDPDCTITVPTWRIDGIDPVVLIEDIARHVGYDNISREAPMSVSTPGELEGITKLRRKLSNILVSQGFSEAYGISLDVPERMEKWGSPDNLIKLNNPMVEDMTILRNSLIPRLIDTMENNIRRDYNNLRFFEIALVFNMLKDGKPEMKWNLGAVALGEYQELDWAGKKGKVDFFYLKGVLENIADSLKLNGLSFEEKKFDCLHPFQSAAVKLDDKEIGYIGALAPEFKEKLDTKDNIYAFEIDISPIDKKMKTIDFFKPISRFPRVKRDIAVLLDAGIKYSEIESLIKSIAPDIVKDYNCFDSYAGKGIEPGKKSLGISIYIQASDRTLTNEEINQTVDNIVGALKEKFKAELRM